MKFYNDGYVTFPYLSDGMWFMTQHRRWGLLKEDPDYLAVAKKVNRIDIYKQAAARDQDAAAEGLDPHREADGRRGVGRQGREEVRRRLQDQGGVNGGRGCPREEIRSGQPTSPPHSGRAPTATRRASRQLPATARRRRRNG